jgi:hypothetical protein
MSESNGHLPVPADTRAPGGTYTLEEVERGLVAVALCSGNSRRAARLLEDQDTPIPRGTLERWKADRADTYERVREDVTPRLKAMLAEEHTDLARAQMDTARKLLTRLDEEAEELPARDLPTAIRNLDVGTGIHTDKSRDLRGEATVVRHETVDVANLLKALQARFPGLIRQVPVDAEAGAEVLPQDAA